MKRGAWHFFWHHVIRNGILLPDPEIHPRVIRLPGRNLRCSFWNAFYGQPPQVVPEKLIGGHAASRTLSLPIQCQMLGMSWINICLSKAGRIESAYIKKYCKV